MPDLEAIAAAIAARYEPPALTAPGSLADVVSATADPPSALEAWPCVVVFADEGELESGNGTRLGLSDYLVRFYLRPVTSGDITQESAQLRAWLGVLIDQHQAAAQLGGLVAVVTTLGWKVGELTYAGIPFAGIELRVRAVTSEGWNVTA